MLFSHFNEDFPASGFYGKSGEMVTNITVCRVKSKGLDLEDLGSHFGINPFSSYFSLETLLL